MHVRWLTAAERADCSVDLDGNVCKPEDFEAGWYSWEGDSDLTTGDWDYLQGPFDTEDDAFMADEEYRRNWEDEDD